MTEIRECAANSCIAPLRIRLRHGHDELGNLDHYPGSSELFPPRAVVPLPRNEPSVPGQESLSGVTTLMTTKTTNTSKIAATGTANAG